MMSILKKLQKSISVGLVFILSILVSLICIEIVLHFLLPKPQIVSIKSSASHLNEGAGQTITVKETPDNGLYVVTDQGLRLKANMKAAIKNHGTSHKDIEMITNSLGYRDEELFSKKKNELRVLMLGDSITLGDYLNQEDTYPDITEKGLQSKYPNKKIQVINSGVGGIELNTEMAILFETGLSTQPDVVVVGLYLNDASVSHVMKVSTVPAWLSKSYLIYYLNLFFSRREVTDLTRVENGIVEEQKQKFIQKASIDETADWENHEEGLNSLIAEHFDDWGYAWSDDYWQRIGETLKLINSELKNRNIKLIVTLFPVRYQVESSYLSNYPQVRFSKLMDELNIANFDLLPILRGKYSVSHQNYFYDQCHYIPEGNIIIGNALANFISDNFIE